MSLSPIGVGWILRYYPSEFDCQIFAATHAFSNPPRPVYKPDQFLSAIVVSEIPDAPYIQLKINLELDSHSAFNVSVFLPEGRLAYRERCFVFKEPVPGHLMRLWPESMDAPPKIEEAK